MSLALTLLFFGFPIPKRLFPFSSLPKILGVRIDAVSSVLENADIGDKFCRKCWAWNEEEEFVGNLEVCISASLRGRLIKCLRDLETLRKIERERTGEADCELI